mmetsp:Transcript_14721/g.44929  ORF Transcript_14721/g.44929 Transcript_14721/m.44929 type:complete len:209 (-) Transcript_14721:1277-1903(-)
MSSPRVLPTPSRLRRPRRRASARSRRRQRSRPFARPRSRPSSRASARRRRAWPSTANAMHGRSPARTRQPPQPPAWWSGGASPTTARRRRRSSRRPSGRLWRSSSTGATWAWCWTAQTRPTRRTSTSPERASQRHFQRAGLNSWTPRVDPTTTTPSLARWRALTLPTTSTSSSSTRRASGTSPTSSSACPWWRPPTSSTRWASCGRVR